ncbi:MAG: hypothetical protein IPP71_14030 [Bacteroidetes bacterium]|nr:hypothetical protein [Bacteroidota bacterium]
MKKLLLTGMALGLVFAVNAQNRPAASNTIKERLKSANKHAPVPYQEEVSGNELPLNKTMSLPAARPSSASKTSVVPQEIIGISTYDLQTNGSVQNRIYKNNGILGASWTYSSDLAGTYPDRGTGYNYYDGTAWGPIPTARIETDRRGWPSLVQLANGGEVVVSHQSVTTATATVTRPVAGTGAWTQTATPAFPGGEVTLWNRTAAGGPDGNTLHMIDISYPTGNGGALVNGLDGCLSYSVP